MLRTRTWSKLSSSQVQTAGSSVSGRMSPLKGDAALLLHEHPCKQHRDFKAARYSRKHINLLLVDNCEEYQRTYGADGRPLEHATISAALVRRAAKYKALLESGSEQAVGNKRTPIGTFFGLGNPALPRAKEVQDKVPNMRPISLTEEVVGSRKSKVQILELAKHPIAADARSQAASEAPRAQPSRLQKPHPWLMPHQLGDRITGKKSAYAVNASRSPIGNFANFDLPPKF